MHSISPLIAQIFDDPHGNRRRGKRDEDGNRIRFESKGRVRSPLRRAWRD